MKTETTQTEQKKTHVPKPELQELNVFAGKWYTEGKSYENAPGDAAIKGIDTYEWLPGGFFLVHRTDVEVGDEKVYGIEIISYDEQSKTYPMRSFDNHGNIEMMIASIRDGIWTLTGKTKRCTLKFSEEDGVMNWKWEQSKDGENWAVLMDVKLTKFE